MPMIIKMDTGLNLINSPSLERYPSTTSAEIFLFFALSMPNLAPQSLPLSVILLPKNYISNWTKYIA